VVTSDMVVLVSWRRKGSSVCSDATLEKDIVSLQGRDAKATGGALKLNVVDSSL